MPTFTCLATNIPLSGIKWGKS